MCLYDVCMYMFMGTCTYMSAQYIRVERASAPSFPQSPHTHPPPPSLPPPPSMCAGIERAMQFFTSPFLGNLSDSIGRKPVLMASLTMHLFSLLLVTAAPRVEHVLMYYIINGGFNVTLTMCNAIVTDLAVKGGEGDLARQYGKLGMAVGFSLVLGPAVGPSLSKLDIRFPLYVALGALIISVGLW